MKLKSYKLFVEKVRNDQHLHYNILQLRDDLKDFGSSNPDIGSSNPDYDYMKFTIKKNDFKIIPMKMDNNVKNIKNLLDRYSKKLLKSNIYMVYDCNDFISYYSFTVYFKILYTQRIKPNKFIYHLSHKKNRDSILKDGLLLKSHDESDDWSYAKQYK